MAEITYSGRGSRGAGGNVPAPQSTPTAQQPVTRTARPSSASPRLEGNPRASRVDASPDAAKPPSAQRMLAFLDSAERAAAQQAAPPTFPSSDAAPDGGSPGAGATRAQHQRLRPKSATPPLRASVGPRILSAGDKPPPRPRQNGRVSVYDHGTEDRAPHAVAGPVILRDLDKPRVGFPVRAPEDFLRAGEGLSLKQRVKLREHLRRNPVHVEAPFLPGNGGVRLAPPPAPPPGSSARPLDWGSSPTPSQPRSLLRTYYDNGTLDFVSIRWRGNREDALVWARCVTRGPEHGGPHTRSYVSWAPEPPSELDIPTWLPIFIDGVREYDEPYRFLAMRGSEEMLLKAGDTLHTFAGSLVPPLKAVLDTREPTAVAVALQLMNTALALDPEVAAKWAPHYWQFAQVLNLFRSRGGSLLVDMGYNTRDVASCRELAGAFMTAFEVAGGKLATAAVRRYSPGYDPAVTDASLARAAARTAAREAGRQPGEFRPFTLF